MKTPDEIKEGLESCVDYYANGCAEQFCDDCPYSENECFQLEKDALAYIRQLEERLYANNEFVKSLKKTIVKLTESLAQVERERGAAVADLKLVRCCGTCVNNEGGCTTECYIVSGTLTGWQWRGVCPENTRDGADE